MEKAIGLFGLVILVALGFACSKNKKQINWRLVGTGIGLQVLLGVLVLGIPALGFGGPLAFIFKSANNAIVAMLNYTAEGSSFLFGGLITDIPKFGFIVAFQVLPTIIFMSALMSVLYHLGVMQKIVEWIAVLMQKLMGISGAESLSVAANVFVGQTEAPLVVKPYVERMTLSELMAVMTGGMATVAGGVLAAYVGLLKDRIPDIGGHLLTASVMSAPAALLMAKMLLPETETPETLGHVPKNGHEDKSFNIIEAAARGAGEGLSLALNVGAMLLAFIALIAMLDGILEVVGQWILFPEWGKSLVPDLFLKDGEAQLSLSVVLGWFFSPLAYIMGIPWGEANIAGALLGEKVVLNEFIAYQHLSQVMGTLSERTTIILSYALCGFANFSSIAIQIGGIGGIAPSRKTDLAKLGILSVVGGSLAAFMTATIAGLLL